MGAIKTEKSKYQSPYSNGKFVTAAQYIIEIVCEKKAKQSGTDLPAQFWKLPEWAAYYKQQLRKCHALLKKYNEKAIIQALRDNRTYKIYSLFAPWLEPIIIEYHKKIKVATVLEAKQAQSSLATPEPYNINETPQIRQRLTRSKGVLDLLGEIDGEEKDDRNERNNKEDS